jgi:thiamine pyrophosphate-dependent acetolactate synthase large subunit-like protein
VETGKMTKETPENDDPTMLKLKEVAKAKGIKGYTKMTRDELEKAIEESEK